MKVRKSSYIDINFYVCFNRGTDRMLTVGTLEGQIYDNNDPTLLKLLRK